MDQAIKNVYKWLAPSDSMSAQESCTNWYAVAHSVTKATKNRFPIPPTPGWIIILQRYMVSK